VAGGYTVITEAWPRQPTPIAELRVRSAQVLRDVVVRGRVALARPEIAQLPGQSPGRSRAPSGAPIPAETAKAAGDESGPREGTDPGGVGNQAHRRGYENGFAEGVVEGRARGSEEVQQLAARAADEASREFDERAERLIQELEQKAQAAYQARVETLDRLIAALPPQLESRLAAAEDDMLALCFEVVCRVLGRSAVQPAAIRAQLTEAMSALRGRQPAAVHLHPDDLQTLQNEPDWMSSQIGGNDVRWVASPQVALGGCIVESPEGGLDVRIETQLDALRELLLQTRRAARAGGAVQ